MKFTVCRAQISAETSTNPTISQAHNSPRATKIMVYARAQRLRKSRSRAWGVTSREIQSATLGQDQIKLRPWPSVRIEILRPATPLVRECEFCTVRFQPRIPLTIAMSNRHRNTRPPLVVAIHTWWRRGRRSRSSGSSCGRQTRSCRRRQWWSSVHPPQDG